MLGSRKLRFFYDESGVSSIEYAVLISTVVCCIGSGLYALGDLSSAEFDKVASAIGSQEGARGSDGAAQVALDAESLKESYAKKSNRAVIIAGIAPCAGCLAPIAFIMVTNRKNKSREEDEEASTSPEVEPETPSSSDRAFAKRQQLRRIFENNMSSLMHGEMKIRHIMSRQITCVRPADKIEKVKELMDSKQVGHVLVVDNDEAIRGMITEMDIELGNGKLARDIMSDDIQTLDADNRIAPAITMLVREQSTYVPVTLKDKLVGVVTTTDFLMSLQCTLQMLSRIVDMEKGAVAEAPGKAS